MRMKKELKLKGGVKSGSMPQTLLRVRGLREGDVIIAIGNTEVSGVKDFEAVLAKVDKSKPVPVLLVRRGELATYAIDSAWHARQGFACMFRRLAPNPALRFGVFS
jgi:type II secretory pathway component PulC